MAYIYPISIIELNNGLLELGVEITIVLRDTEDGQVKVEETRRPGPGEEEGAAKFYLGAGPGDWLWDTSSPTLSETGAGLEGVWDGLLDLFSSEGDSSCR